MSEAGFTSVDPAEFARSIATTPEEELAEGLRGELRGPILDEIFRRMEEHFRADKAQGVDAVVRFVIGGRADGGADSYEATIRNGACTVSRDLVAAPRVTIATDRVNFLKLVTGNANGPEFFMTGKLRVEGDLMFAAQVTGFFTVPNAA
jgi:putative sterol carrier protein